MTLSIRRIVVSWIMRTVAVPVLVSLSVCTAHAQTESTLYSFTCCVHETNLAIDKDGNLYGTTFADNGGTVYKVTPSGEYTLLYEFDQIDDGEIPLGGMTLDQQGNLYGTTEEGGPSRMGVIFEISSSGTETTLYNFGCDPDGCYPRGSMVMDSQGNLYGATRYGGNNYGTVFKFVPSTGTLTTLYSFTGGPDGCYPWSVTLDNAGNLYGTTAGGCGDLFGLVFKVTPSGVETVLHSFSPNGKDGFYPKSGVVIDAQGNLYGTTLDGGAKGLGTVYKVSSKGKESILHSFKGKTDGISPQASLALDASGNLYGTTQYGGSLDLGVVFKLVKTRETILHSFAFNGLDGAYPMAGVVFDAAGNLFGTTLVGGNSCPPNGCGIIYKITPQTPAGSSIEDVR